MLEAILFFLTGCSVGSSKPNEKLEPPPGGRKTRELFLLLGSTPLKVVVVVMAPRREVGWRGDCTARPAGPAPTGARRRQQPQHRDLAPRAGYGCALGLSAQAV